MSTSSTSTPSPTEPEIVCTVPTDVIADPACNGSVVPGTTCNFKCTENDTVHKFNCTATGSWDPKAPTCGNLSSNATVVLNARRKRRDTLPLDNQDVLTVQETFESAILGIPTTYLVNVTTINAQNLSNGQIQMNLLIGVMYTSDVTVERLVVQIEEALLAVNEFRVVSVDVLDLDALCSPTPCKNNGECRVDYTTFDFTCVCASGYSGRVCTNSSNVVILAILVPITILILLFFIVLVVYHRVRLHKLEWYKKRPFHGDMKARRYEDYMQQLYFTDDRRHQHLDPETYKNSAIDLRFSKEINARMRERSRQMKSQGHHPSASQHDPTGRHRSQTDPVQSGRSLQDRPVTGDQGIQGHRPNRIRSRGNPSLNHQTGNTSDVYNKAANSNQNNVPGHSSSGNRINQAASTSQNNVYNRGRSRVSVDDRNMVPLGRSRNTSMPADVHVANGFNDTRL